MRGLSNSRFVPAPIKSLASRNSAILTEGWQAVAETLDSKRGNSANGGISEGAVIGNLTSRMLDPSNKAQMTQRYIASEAMDHLLAGLLPGSKNHLKLMVGRLFDNGVNAYRTHPPHLTSGE